MAYSPLTTVLGWLRMIRAGQLSGTQRDRGLETVERNTRTLAQMIDDLLDISRIAAGKMPLDRRPTDIGPLVTQTVDSFGQEARERDSADPRRGHRGRDRARDAAARLRAISSSGPDVAGAQCGLGLGLAIVREIVTLHGGRVEAHSEGAGRGSTFIVTLALHPGGQTLP